MTKEIPAVSFRLEHGFAVKPDLEVDPGPASGLLMGCNSPDDPMQAIYLGKHAETGYKNVWLDTRGAHVLYVMGKRRSGKSYTLGAIAEGLVSQGWIAHGTAPQGVLILDTMNVFLTMPFPVAETFGEAGEPAKELLKWQIQSETPPITLFRPRGTNTPPGVPSMEVTLRPSDLAPEEWCGLFDADPFADPLGHLITDLFAKVAQDGYADVQRGNVPPNPNFGFPDLMQALETAHEIQRFPRETRESLRRRLDAARRLRVFSDAGLDVRQLLRPGHLSVILLRDLDQQLRSVLVALIVKRTMQLRGVAEQHERMIPIHLARAARARESDKSKAQSEEELAEECKRAAREGLPRSWIIIDEAHNYIPSRESVPSRKPLKKYVDEGRNLGLSIVVATQQPSGLDPSIQRNADVLLVHALSHHDDILAAAGMINTAMPSEVVVDRHVRMEGARSFETLVRRLPLGYALAATDRANRLFPIKIRPRITVHGGSDY